MRRNHRREERENNDIEIHREEGEAGEKEWKELNRWEQGYTGGGVKIK
jgi:hypothetical protein